MPVEIGTHRNGERYARVTLSSPGVTATVEGTGADDDIATEVLEIKLRQLAELAEAAADDATRSSAVSPNELVAPRYTTWRSASDRRFAASRDIIRQPSATTCAEPRRLHLQAALASSAVSLCSSAGP